MIQRTCFDRAFEAMERKGWDNITVAVDLHDTVFKSTYSEEVSEEFYPYAKETLQLMSEHPQIKMYMFTCTPSKIRRKYRKFLLENNIVMSTHPKDVMNSMRIKENAFQAYDTKPYYNVLLDDKAGFDPDQDWIFLLTYFKLQQTS